MDNEQFVTLDTYFAEKNITVVKADIEGAEIDMLRGGERTFKDKVKQTYICTYHLPGDEKDIRELLCEYGFKTEFNKRYMLVHYEPSNFRKRILRRGIIRGTK